MGYEFILNKLLGGEPTELKDLDILRHRLINGEVKFILLYFVF